MHDFIYQSQPSKIIFGAGALAQVAQEVEALGARKALILCTPEQTAQASDVSNLLGPLSAGIFAEAKMHVPIETARRAREHARSIGADCAVAIGGGSTVGLG